uniref:Uncharacterized protein n=1 Tax=Anopheles quadriannulatus TaxID=34691 RepID=A0A182XT99_ANOQN
MTCPLCICCSVSLIVKVKRVRQFVVCTLRFPCD